MRQKSLEAVSSYICGFRRFEHKIVVRCFFAPIRFGRCDFLHDYLMNYIVCADSLVSKRLPSWDI